jgi:hypothetical protein
MCAVVRHVGLGVLLGGSGRTVRGRKSRLGPRLSFRKSSPVWRSNDPEVQVVDQQVTLVAACSLRHRCGAAGCCGAGDGRRVADAVMPDARVRVDVGPGGGGLGSGGIGMPGVLRSRARCGRRSCSSRSAGSVRPCRAFCGWLAREWSKWTLRWPSSISRATRLRGGAGR